MGDVYSGIGLQAMYVRDGSMGNAQKNPWSYSGRLEHCTQTNASTCLHGFKEIPCIHLKLSAFQSVGQDVWKCSGGLDTHSNAFPTIGVSRSTNFRLIAFPFAVEGVFAFGIILAD